MNLINIIKSNFNKKIIFNILFFIIIALIFALAYRQSPLYMSNQHTKFLHGLAHAGYGNLKNDWTANTIDPLPVFSFLVFITYKFMHEYMFYLYYVIILGIFILSLYKISDYLFNFDKSFLKKIIFFVILITIHSAIFDSITYNVSGFRLSEWIIEKGVAMQYLLGSYFQPCVFGVFLLLSIYLFLKKKYYFAIFFLIVSSYFHSIYVFSSGILTLCYMIIVYKDTKSMRQPIIIGLLAFILILPILIYNFIYLGPTSSELENRALDILVNIRIPHHSDPRLWFNISTIVKMIIITLSLYIVRKTKLFLVILIPFVIAIASTIIYFYVKIDFIGLLAPWRVSVWLLPLSTSIIIGYFVKFVFNRLSDFIFKYKRVLSYVFIFILLLHASYGTYGIVKQFKEYLNIDNGQMMNFVKKNKSNNDLYLVPIDMQDFRLNTGAPVFVTHKSHPYKDVEVIEWHARIKLAEEFYGNENYNDMINILNKIKKKDKLTHVIMRINNNFKYIDMFDDYYVDDDFIIYKIK